MNSFDALDFSKIKALIENKTGFKCYEGQPGEQMTFYGTSDKLAEFKEIAEPFIRTGTMAFCMDTKSYELWSAFTKQWY